MSLSNDEERAVTQDQVTAFYDGMVFPSKTSHKAYEELVPTNLNGMKVGDFGCGQSLFIDVFKKLEYDAVFLDISQNALATIDYGEKIHASLTDIPLEDNYMDVIFCIGVVHHIPEMEKAISEIARVMKRGGKLYLGVYSDTSLQAQIRKHYDNTDNVSLKNFIYSLTGMLIWFKNRKNIHYKSIDNYKRTDDLLKTPLVRYLNPEYYSDIFRKYGCSLIEIKRISSMNILIYEKQR
jgi:ubiquinone/menaquinone biosynthesis C-methylase UbiE